MCWLVGRETAIREEFCPLIPRRLLQFWRPRLHQDAIPVEHLLADLGLFASLIWFDLNLSSY